MREPNRRDYEIVFQREFEGATLQEIGDRHGISAEYVRQILRFNGCGPVTNESFETIRRREEARARNTPGDVRYVTRMERPWKRCTICDGMHHHIHTFLGETRVEFVPGRA